MLGFYVESHGSGDGPDGDGDGDNGVVLLSSANYTSELVWFASIDVTAVQPSRSGSCPYPVGTNGVLNSSTHAAPVISISMMTTPCRSSESHTPFTTTHLMGILIAVSVIVVVILVTIMTMMVLYCIKQKGSHVGIRYNEQLHTETQIEENCYDYPEVETVPPIQLQDNQAYETQPGTHSVMENITCVTVNATSPSFELQENVAYT